ncbi:MULTISPECIES: chromosomal replication initiator protein DnaA [Carnobacterium]|uniref:Chromosomal replication initiator protein DnaA n=1 Tax=Carnobacterium divergens TaxID=2748 RepID=A0A2R8A461_CARDV|nr:MULTISPECIES: chromosomal replication initiator protein DnaA [Carnobacterium]MCO6019060.1 chromosomal replication initiator protein DnaA [Carnobacterium divergens]MDT1940734.1 chromosomal replication initiator protein DnaA [Carnobacterium divergens]MDT1943172.1 chromosomal replication initiator protein DnaA [Carnobacterium divergens]MDT1948979.1 chromosomal replication initiator protein DnaA [Carnobacterium divergens]MDT1951460.1 chromosomal replication initiator protein DnaA [Carnobacteriu
MDDLQNLWSYLKEKFKESLSKVSYDTWIESAHPIRITDQNIIIEVPSSLHKEYWENNLATRIVENIYEYSSREISPLFIIKNEQDPNETTVLRKSDSFAKNSPVRKDAQLNDKYTFDTFVIGKGNQMAHAAALVVAEEPGTIYNPLFFYGGVGLGKTHLMHAIGHQMLLINPDAKVKYVSSETFANDFINSIQTKSQEKFRNEYRSVDLLLVDDIQFFADKEGTQEEFFHTFNALYDERKQIVLTSDRLPNEIPKLQERLVSRFAWGLSVDITPPDLETRIAILRKKANAERLEIPGDTLSYIAGQIDSNIRELEGALVRVQAYAAIESRDISTSLAADALKSIIPSGKPATLSILEIQSTVCKYYQIALSDLKGKKRVKSIVVPRQIAMYLSRELTSNSLPKIGAEFGGKDHTTVIHAYEKIEHALTKDEELRRDIEEIKNKLKS